MLNETDRNDARGLAQILRTGWYSRVYVTSLHSHQVQALRERLVVPLRACAIRER
jgi:hypothetical protein